MSKFVASDYAEMKFRIDKVDLLTYDPVVSFPEISHYPQFTRDEYLSRLNGMFRQVFSYICFAYDPKSPYVTHNENLIKRKRDAAIAAGFSISADGKFDSFTQDVIVNRNPAVNRMIIAFCRILRSTEWMTLVAYNESLYSQLQTMLDTTINVNAKDQSTLLSNTQNLTTAIELLKKNILQGDNSEDLVEALYDTIEIDELDLKPEDIAMRFAMKENPKLFNPYTAKGKVIDFVLEHRRNANLKT